MKPSQLLAKYPHIQGNTSRGLWRMECVYAALEHLDNRILADKLPADFSAEIQYQGFTLRVYNTQEKTTLMRCVVRCHCGRSIAASRMGQHLPYCKAK